jgi:hypothetical protein
MEGDARGAESQILFLPNVKMQDGNLRDIAVVSAMNNDVWCFDANTSDDLWMAKLGIPINGSGEIDFHNINDHWGVLSTGVIDPETQRWYGVAVTSPDGDPRKGVHAVYSLNLKDGSLAQAPAIIPNGYDSVMRKQRSSLQLASLGGRQTIVFASGAVIEIGPTSAHGFIIAYDPAWNRITAMLDMASTGYSVGVWMSGGAPLIIGEDIVYTTGNGTFDGRGSWGNSAIKLRYRAPGSATANDGALTVMGNWTAYSDAGRVGMDPAKPTAHTEREAIAGMSLPTFERRQARNEGLVAQPHATNKASMSDEDFGSAPPAYDPETRTIYAGGKDGIVYPINADNMGNTQPPDLRNPLPNYAKLRAKPVWIGRTPGSPQMGNTAPQNVLDLNNEIEPDGKTHHLHHAIATCVIPGMGRVFAAGPENSNVELWRAKGDGSIEYLACSRDIASPNCAPPGGMTGWSLAFSTNGKPGGTLLWGIMPYGDANSSVTDGRLVVFDPENLGRFSDGRPQLNILWDSAQWNVRFKFNKFAPLVLPGNGRCYVPTYDGNIGHIVLGLA